MKRHYSNQQGLAWLLLLGAAVMIGVGAFTNHWSQSIFAHRGLVKFCAFGDDVSSIPRIGNALKWVGKGLQILNGGELCINRLKPLIHQFENPDGEPTDDAKEVFKSSGMELIVLGTMVIAFGTTVIALLVAPCCCTRCNCCIHFFIILAILADGLGLGLYAYHAKHDGDILIEWNFDWSYWVTLGSLAALIVADVLFCIGNRPVQPPVANPPYEIMPMEA